MSWRWLLFAAALLCLLFLFRLGDRDLNSSHEARAAQNAQKMLDDGDWSLPRLFNRRIDVQKPPLYYWLVALFGWLNGGAVTPWIVRLPAALAALGCIALVRHTGRRLGNRRTGLFAAAVLATSLHFTWLGRVGRIDMPFTFAVTLAVAGQMLGRFAQKENRSGLAWFVAGYLGVAAGILLKGPLCLVLFWLIMTACWIERRISARDENGLQQASIAPRHRSTWWWGYPLVLVLAAPWFIWANLQTNNQIWEVFFLHHNFERGVGGSEALASHPVLYYLPRLAIDLLPWSVVAPLVFWLRRRAKGPSASPLGRQGLFWFVSVVAFLSLMSFKRADYLLPAFPGFALMLGVLLDDVLTWLQQHGSTIVMRRLSAGIVAVVVTTCLGWFAYLQWFDVETRQGWVMQRLGHDIRRRTTMPVIFFRVEAHALAFHVGRPLDTILEWENLDKWASRREEVFFVLPPDAAAQWREHLRTGRLIEVRRTDEGRGTRPLVIMRSPGQQVAATTR